MLDNEIILKQQDRIAELEFKISFLVGEMRNCKRIFDHHEMPGYSSYVSFALDMVDEK